jgi:hypothetical protein
VKTGCRRVTARSAARPRRPHARRTLEGFEPLLEGAPLGVRVDAGRVLVNPSVVSELVAGIADAANVIRIGEHGVSRDEERPFDAAVVEQLQEALDRFRAELAA